MFKLFKKFFKKTPVSIPDPVPTTISKRALFFAINNYKGSENDLRGCLNDQTNFVKRLTESYPGFDIKVFRDAQVTMNTFITQVTNAIKALRTGDILLVHYSGHGTQVVDRHADETDGYDEALYLYDGPVIDDNIGEALKSIPDGAKVILFFDSCFSGTITRMVVGKKKVVNRFVPTSMKAVDRKKRIRIAKEEMKWLVFSGCGEHQTSADAYINGSYNGAFTYYALSTLTKDMTYRQWIKAIVDKLAKYKYEQVPTLEGYAPLMDEKVFN